MKKLIIAVVIFTTAFAHSGFAQVKSQEPFDNLIAAYLNLKNALANDNGDSARLAAKSLYETIDKLPMDKLSADQHKIWMQYYEKLSYDAEHIKGTDEIDHQREHFESLSVNMYKLLKALNINAEVLYYQYCPMVNAYWISKDSIIHNPYYGAKMPKCGSTKETLKVKE